MKVKVLLGLGAVLVCLVGIVLAVDSNSATKEAPVGVALVTDLDKTSYAVGVAMTQNLKGVELNLNALCQGIRDQMDGKKLAIANAEIGAILKAFSEKMRKVQEEQRAKQMEIVKKLAAKNKEIGAAFLAENGKKEGVKTTESGLQYLIIEQGSGNTPAATDTLKVHYTGTTTDGEQFDSSVKRKEPFEFSLTGGVIQGWIEGFQLLKEGGKAKLFIPGDLAYPNGKGGIEPYETLIFEVELLEINPAQE